MYDNGTRIKSDISPCVVANVTTGDSPLIQRTYMRCSPNDCVTVHATLCDKRTTDWICEKFRDESLYMYTFLPLAQNAPMKLGESTVVCIMNSSRSSLTMVLVQQPSFLSYFPEQFTNFPNFHPNPTCPRITCSLCKTMTDAPECSLPPSRTNCSHNLCPHDTVAILLVFLTHCTKPTLLRLGNM